MSAVRVRFAPSPTGQLHAGNVRTALLNWVFARQQKGSLILRIEDTDQERNVAGSEELIYEDLHWLGIDWQEGPDVGGDHGPYRQSERAEYHKQYAEQLCDEGKAYRCYCSPEQLENERKEALASGSPPRYSGRCRDLSKEEESKFISDGIEPVIRFKVREGEISFNDLIKGDISWKLSNIGDFVIVRSSGVPAYNFVVVVDDALMNITHVIRGEGHVSNTPKQILLHEAMGFEPPKFAHTATILNKEKKTLSKRNGALSVKRYREEGYMPDALINYLSLLSWSSESGDEILDAERIINEFSFKRMSSSAAVFDDDKLKWMNGQYLRSQSIEKLVELCTPFLRSAGFAVDDVDKVSSILDAIRDNLYTASDVAEHAAIFFTNSVEPAGEDEKEIIKNEDSQKIFNSFNDALDNFDNLGIEEFRAVMKEVQEKTDLKGKNLWMPVRIAITGQSHGPELPKLVEYFGKDEIISRMKRAIITK